MDFPLISSKSKTIIIKFELHYGKFFLNRVEIVSITVYQVRMFPHNLITHNVRIQKNFPGIVVFAGGRGDNRKIIKL